MLKNYENVNFVKKANFLYGCMKKIYIDFIDVKM